MKTLLGHIANKPLNLSNFPLSRWSMFNSPYHVHNLGAGIDIYPETLFNQVKNSDPSLIPSPLNGVLRYHTKFEAPKGYRFIAEPFDHLLIIEPTKDSPFQEQYFRLLHVDPVIKKNSIIEAGQPLGRLVQSGFFSFWTDLHIHLEIRQKPNQFTSRDRKKEHFWKRAKGGQLFTSINLPPPSTNLTLARNHSQTLDLNGVCKANHGNYLEVTLDPKHWCRCGDRIGFPVWYNNMMGILDAGIAYYPWGGIIFPTNPQQPKFPLKSSDSPLVYTQNGFPLGKIVTLRSNYGVFKPYAISANLNNQKIRGISFFIFKEKPLLKIIPTANHSLQSIKETEQIQIQLRTKSSVTK